MIIMIEIVYSTRVNKNIPSDEYATLLDYGLT